MWMEIDPPSTLFGYVVFCRIDQTHFFLYREGHGLNYFNDGLSMNISYFFRQLSLRFFPFGIMNNNTNVMHPLHCNLCPD